MDPAIWLLSTTHRTPESSCSRRTLHVYGLGVPSCRGILGYLGIFVPVWKRWVAQALGGQGGRYHWLPLLNMLPSCLGCRWGGIGSDGLACWDLHYGEMVFVSFWISKYWYISSEIWNQTGYLSGCLDVDLLGFVFVFLWDIHFFRRSGAR